MKVKAIALWLLAGAMVLAGCSAPLAPDVESVTSAVNEIWDRYSSTYNAGDLGAWMSLWTDEGIQMPPDEAPRVGREAIRARNGPLLDQFTYDMRITNEEVGVAAGWAFARGRYSATLTPKAGGEFTSIDGKYMTILQRQPDGSWKIHRDIFNSNVPAATVP